MAGAFPVEEAPQRRFATISSQDEYLIFPPTDLGEADAGFHVRGGEMAGYWHHPPFRLFRSMHVYCGGVNASGPTGFSGTHGSSTPPLGGRGGN
ncbi:hypothetical protein [Thermogymnomonas acidicola]|uniref:hypothetical protein n=1 Tax=Thermogymnomonas acidicola TaxID=399579 RepID=UPI0009465B09|nr:hypothetical protein [Thermogymnomonas acidicola]